MTNDFTDDEIHELSEIRGLLEPLPGTAERVVSAALELGRKRRPHVALTGIAIAIAAAAFALLIRSHGRSTPEIQISNAGSVVFVISRETRWAISGSRLASKKSIVIAKGEDR